MGKLKILTALLLAAALTACGDDSDVFYTTSYPVARIEVSVSLSEPEKPDPENPDPENRISVRIRKGKIPFFLQLPGIRRPR